MLYYLYEFELVIYLFMIILLLSKRKKLLTLLSIGVSAILFIYLYLFYCFHKEKGYVLYNLQILEPVLLIFSKEREKKITKSVSGRLPQTTVFRSSHVHSWTWTVYGPSCLAFLPASVRPPSQEGCPCALRQPLPSWPWYGPC